MAKEDFYSSIVALAIWKSVPPILLLIGTVGNVLAIIVLTRKQRGSPTSKLLVSLSVVDLVVLYTGLLRQWIKYTFNYDVRVISDLFCKLHLMLVYAGLQASSWLLVMITLQRACSVVYPHRVQTWFTKKGTFVALFAILLSLLLINSHFAFGFHVIEVEVQNETLSCCNPVDRARYLLFLDISWPWIDFLIAFLLPFVVLLIGNFAILMQLKSNHNFRKTSVSSVTGAKTVQTLMHPSRTAMLIAFAIVFFICVSPISIFMIGQIYWWPDDTLTEPEMANSQLTWALTNMLMYTNNSVNFILYCLCGTRFRDDVKSLFCKTRKRSKSKCHQCST